MRKTILIVLAFILCKPLISQTSYEEIKSLNLSAVRELKIKLPKNYDPSSELKYPLIIVFDGDYLFEPVAGQVDFQTYFDDMPGSIIVGVVQGIQRNNDAYCDEISGLPIETGLEFHNFVADELIPYLDGKYNTSEFRVAVGHDLMGNFINSYLFKGDPLFKAYVCISPDLSGSVKDFLGERLEFFKDDIFYYMATSDKDLPNIRETVLSANTQIAAVKNQYLTYYFDDFKNDTHYSLVTSAISKSFDKIFQLYKPLREKELEEKVFTYEGTLDEYLVNRHKKIENYFGVKKPITMEEIEKIVMVAEQRGDLESLEKIGKLANKLNPTSSLGTYYLAQHAEKSGKTKKAEKLYEAALTLEDMAFFNGDVVLATIDGVAVADIDEEIEKDNDEDN